MTRPKDVLDRVIAATGLLFLLAPVGSRAPSRIPNDSPEARRAARLNQVRPDGSCFPRGPEPWAGAVAESTYGTIFYDRQNAASGTGTAFKVAGTDLLLTATHVTGLRPLMGVDTVQIRASDNTRIGNAVLATVTSDYKTGDGEALGVLAFQNFASPAAEARFLAAPGIRLARAQAATGTLQGVFSNPALPSHGNSGGPALNNAGEVVGVVVSGRQRSETVKLNIKSMFPGDTGDGASTQIRSGRLSLSSIVDPRIIRRLGPAAAFVQKVVTPPEPVTTYGYSLRACLVAHGEVATGTHDSIAAKNFDTPAGMAPALGTFKQWSQPLEALHEAQRLLARAHDALPEDRQVSHANAAFANVRDLQQIPFYPLKREPFGPGSFPQIPDTSIEEVTAAMRSAATKVSDPILARDLVAASEQLPASFYIKAAIPRPAVQPEARHP